MHPGSHRPPWALNSRSERSRVDELARHAVSDVQGRSRFGFPCRRRRCVRPLGGFLLTGSRRSLRRSEPPLHGQGHRSAGCWSGRRKGSESEDIFPPGMLHVAAAPHCVRVTYFCLDLCTPYFGLVACIFDRRACRFRWLRRLAWLIFWQSARHVQICIVGTYTPASTRVKAVGTKNNFWPTRCWRGQYIRLSATGCIEFVLCALHRNCRSSGE